MNRILKKLTIRPKKMSNDKQIRYREFQKQGAIREEWIANPDSAVPCPASKSEFSFKNADDSYWEINNYEIGLPDSFEQSDMEALNIREQVYQRVNADMYSDEGEVIAFSGRAGKKVLFIEDITKGSETGPWISEVCMAAYQMHFPLFTLRHIFIANLNEKETKEFATERLKLEMDPKAFKSGTPEFQQILGTRIGKTVAYIVLNSFDRGTRKISKISMWLTGGQSRSIQARFDLELVSGNP